VARALVVFAVIAVLAVAGAIALGWRPLDTPPEVPVIKLQTPERSTPTPAPGGEPPPAISVPGNEPAPRIEPSRAPGRRPLDDDDRRDRRRDDDDD
jgi:hypothetical protein